MDILIGLVLLVCAGIFFYLVSLFPFSIYIKCMSAQVPCGMFQLVAMQLRKVPTTMIIENYIKARKAGIDVTLDKLEVHFLSGGNLSNIINALISASRSNIQLGFAKAAAIDLAGRNVSDAVRMSVQPRVLNSGRICGISKDGIELIVKANITIRSNLETMVGGAGEDTVLARVNEGIVSQIGSSETHSVILNKPEILTKKVISEGLDAGTAFEIVSLDISDIDVGRNIGAHLKNEQAVADKKIAEARAEGRRAMAVAVTKENIAAEQEARARLVEAEQKVPHALADTFRTGKLIVKRKKRAKKLPTPDNTPPSGTGPGLGFGDDPG